MTSTGGGAGCVRGGGGGCGWGWSSSRDEEWDQEPWVHEKHGGVRGGLGQGKERGAGCVGGGGRASGRACTGGRSSFGWGGVGGRGNGSSLTPPPLRLGSADIFVHESSLFPLVCHPRQSDLYRLVT